ncbi:helix-turn-helix transcriptional regulator [Amycolatopsis tucumanensis]|uniref:helix-turn-helix transcriptional regulator n=1 Tax=Amycolatopsis tucumanensis TaxID=401106 RepID=UPI003D75BE4E
MGASGADTPSGLIGRDALLNGLRDFVRRSAQDGEARAIVGEAGIGKTALLKTACAYAEEAGMRTLRVTGAEFEAEIGYAGLHALLLPLRDVADDCAPPLREALRVALGRQEGPAPRQLMVFNAVFELVSLAARTRPVLLCVDDLQWLDQATITAIGFLARRVRGTSVGVLAASRSAHVLARSGIPVVHIGRLSPDHARELLSRRRPPLPPRLEQRVLSEADGNPLALLELARSVSDLADPLGHLPAVLPLTTKLERAFAVRTATLPEQARQALLRVAVDGRADLRHLLHDGLTVDDLAPAEAADLIAVDRRAMTVAFSHPLIRSAVVGSAAPADLRRAHAAIADRLDDDPARQAWHLSEATITPDEDVAARLEAAAHAFLARGDAPMAVTLLIRAARLSPLGSSAARRLAEAASLAAQVTGDLDDAARLLDEARRLNPRVTNSLHAAAAAAYITVNREGDVDTAFRLLLGAIESASSDAPGEEHGEALTTLLYLSWWAGREDYWTSFHRALARLGDRVPPLLRMLSLAFADPVRHGPAIRPQVAQLVERNIDEYEPTQIVRVMTSAIYLDMLTGCRGVAWRLVEGGRQGNAVRSSLGALMLLCLDDFASGRWDEAERLADEGIHRCRAHGYDFLAWYFLYNKALLAAVRGEPATTHEWTTELSRLAASRKAATPAQYGAHPRTLAAIGAGDWESAFRHASTLSAAGTFAPHRPIAMWVAFDLVESALRTGREDAARAHVAAIVANDIGALSPRMAVIALGARALVAEGADGEQLFEEALAVDDAGRFPFDLARVQLAYGERLRRNLRFVRAREVLHFALETFERLGAEPWAARTRQELRAARDPETKVPVTAPEKALTAQERAIAELAAAGFSNKEIARRLYLSPRTVGGHLYRTFPKLGISTRAALRDALERIDDRETAPAG